MTKRPRIVVIDDDDGIREVLCLTLTGEGYDVETAENAAAGLASLVRQQADLVIADLKMPDIDGVAFCRAYAKYSDGARPVILMSAMPAQTIDQSLPGVVEFVTKPFDVDPFLELVARAISRGVGVGGISNA
jgi:DNA-binding NtrC family response regulator